MSTYTEKHKAYYQANKDRIKEKLWENQKIWLKTPRGIFSTQKRKAKQRGIPWELTFEEWWSIWQESGKWEQRGNFKDKYCMCRYGDTGHYSSENVRIDTFNNNSLENYDVIGINSRGQFNKK